MPKHTYGITGYKTPQRYTHRTGKDKLGDALTHHELHKNCVTRTKLLQKQVDKLETKIAALEKKVGDYSHPHPTPIGQLQWGTL